MDTKKAADKKFQIQNNLHVAPVLQRSKRAFALDDMFSGFNTTRKAVSSQSLTNTAECIRHSYIEVNSEYLCT